jgi:hypothetical protein
VANAPTNPTAIRRGSEDRAQNDENESSDAANAV